MYKFNFRRGRLVIGVALLVLGGLWLAANWPGLLARLARVALLQKGEVRATASLSGILVADQQVLVAPAAGRITWLVPDGQRVRVDMTVARIVTPGGRAYDVNAPAAGLLAHTADGLETVLRPANLSAMNMPDGAGKPVTVAEGSAVTAGQALGRVTDNLDPVYLYVDAASPMPSTAKTWTLVWQGGDLRATVAGHRGAGVFLRLDTYPDQLLAGRRVDFAVVTRVLSGYLVPETALVSRGGHQGIYLVESGQARWEPVRVAGELQGMAALTGPFPDQVNLYVTTPRWVRDGVTVS